MTYKNKFFNTDIRACYGLSVLEYGWQQSDPLHRYGPKMRNHFVLHYIKEGSGKYVANNKSFLLKKNDLFIIYPSVSAWYEAAQKDPWEYWWIGFTGIDAARLVKQTGALEETPILSITDGSNLLHLFENLQNAAKTVYNMNALFFQIFDEIFKNAENKETRQNLNYLLSKSLDIINSQKAQLSVQVLADRVGISRSQLFRIFYRELSITPQHYIINYKLNLAMELLRNTHLTVSQIAEETGFCDASHFSREMKKYINATPVEYRKSIHTITAGF